MRIRLKYLFDFLSSAPADGHVLTYRASDQKYINKALPNTMKIVRGSTTCNGSGLFSVDLSSAGFTSAPFFAPVARNVSNDRANRRFAGVTSVSATAASGTVCRATSTSLLGIGTTLENGANGTVVDWVAIGT